MDPHNKPVRACVAAPMAHPDILVEVMVVAAKLKRSKSPSPTPSLVVCHLWYCSSFGAVDTVWPDSAGTGGGKSQPLGKRLPAGEV